METVTDIIIKPLLTGPLLRRSPNERCGVVMGIRKGTVLEVVRFIEVRNVHPDPRHNFRMLREDVHTAMRRTLTAKLGYWHTHPHGPDTGPSEGDMEWMARYPHLVGLVVHVPTAKATWYDHNNIIKEVMLDGRNIEQRT